MATPTMTRAAAALLVLVVLLFVAKAPTASAVASSSCDDSCRSFFAGNSQARGGCCDADCLCKLWSSGEQYVVVALESSIRVVCGLCAHNCD